MRAYLQLLFGLLADQLAGDLTAVLAGRFLADAEQAVQLDAAALARLQEVDFSIAEPGAAAVAPTGAAVHMAERAARLPAATAFA